MAARVRSATGRRPPPAQARSELCCRLGERRTEIEQAALTRVYAIAEPIEAADPQYADGLRSAVSAALDYGFAAIEHGEREAPPVPTSLLAQARLAARNGVNLDTVLRRYFAGYTLFGDYLVQEAGGDPNLTGEELKRLLRAEAVFFDRLVVAVSEEYGREDKSRPEGSAQRREALVKRLLAGEPVDASKLGYELDAWHLSAVATGPDAEGVLRELLGALDCRMLLVGREEGEAWAWMGARQRPDPADVGESGAAMDRPGISLAIGEPGRGLVGWRMSHRQAKAALTVAQRSTRSFARYAEVALIAAALQDELLSTSLRELYLAPLERQRDGGAALRRTLRAYFAAGRNVSSAAAALGVIRHTVTYRLRAAEELFGRLLDDCIPDIEVALRLAEHCVNVEDEHTPDPPGWRGTVP